MRRPSQPESPQQILSHLLEQARRLHRGARFRQGLRSGALVSTIAVVGCGLAYTLGALPLAVSAVIGAIAAVVGPFAVGLGYALLSPPTDRDLALQVDRTLGTHELHLTAVWLASGEGPTPDSASAREVWQRLTLVDGTRLLPLRGSIDWRPLALLLVAIVGSSALWSRDPWIPPEPTPLHSDNPVAQEGQRLAEQLEETAELAETLSPEIRQELAQLAEEMIREEVDINDAQERLEELRSALSAEDAGDVLERLEDAAEALDNDLTSALGDAMAQGNPQAAEDAARALQEQLQGATGEQREQAAQALQAAADRLSSSDNGSEQAAAESMRQAAESLRQAGSQSGLNPQQMRDLRQALQDAQELSKQAQADQQAMRRSQELNGALQQAQQRLEASQAPEDGEGQPTSGGEGAASEGSSGSGQGQGQDGESAGSELASGQQAGEQGGPSSLEHTWEDQGEFTHPSDTRLNGNRNDTARTDPGQTADDFERFYKAVRMEGAKSLVTSPDSQLDASGQMDLIPTRLTSGDESASAAVAMPEAYREAAEAAMSEEPIPPGYRETIRTYFDASRED